MEAREDEVNERQRRFLEYAAKERGLYWADVEELCWGVFKTNTSYISHTQARQLCQIVLRQPKP